MTRRVFLPFAASVVLLSFDYASGQSLSLDHVDGINLEGQLETGVPITFYIRVTGDNNSHGGISNGFRVYSPDGAHWGTTIGDTTGTLGRTQFDGGFFINSFSVTGSGADTVGFGGFRFFSTGLPAGFDDIAYTIEIGPIDTAWIGHEICLDSTFYPPSGVWKWSGPDVYPAWSGPHCFRIGDGPIPGPSLSLDHVDGLDLKGNLQMGVPVEFHIRVTGDNDAHGGVSNGFRVYSPDGAQWGTTIGDTTGTLGRAQFDGGFVINSFSVTGSGADTVGFGGFRFFSTGLPAGFNDIAYAIEIGPIDSVWMGKEICLDSTFYPPAGVWKWSGPDVFPAWSGPHCFAVGGCCIPPLRGNVDYDNGDNVNIVDLTFMVAYLFSGGPAPPCHEEGDYNADDDVNIVDLTGLVAYLFGGGPPPEPCP